MRWHKHQAHQLRLKECTENNSFSPEFLICACINPDISNNTSKTFGNPQNTKNVLNAMTLHNLELVILQDLIT